MKKLLRFEDLERRLGSPEPGKETPQNTISVFRDPKQATSYFAIPGIRAGAIRYIHFSRPHLLSPDQRIVHVPSYWVDHRDRSILRSRSAGPKDAPNVSDNTNQSRELRLAAELEQIKHDLRAPGSNPCLADQGLSLSGQLSQLEPSSPSVVDRSQQSSATYAFKALADSTFIESRDVLFQAELESGRRHARKHASGKPRLTLFQTPLDFRHSKNFTI